VELHTQPVRSSDVLSLFLDGWVSKVRSKDKLSSSRGALWHRRKGLERKMLGVCAACGKAPAIVERTCCAPCLADLRRRTKERTAKRKSLGLCVTCGQRRAQGIVHCRKCRPLSDRVAASRSAVRERREAKEEKETLARLLAMKHLRQLTPRQREVILLRAGLDRHGKRTGADVAAMLGITRQGVMSIEKSAWRRIHRAEAGLETRVERPAHHESTRAASGSTDLRAA
jgi:DNA-directed RNA polymerase specialized sigma24 family protein